MLSSLWKSPQYQNENEKGKSYEYSFDLKNSMKESWQLSEVP